MAKEARGTDPSSSAKKGSRSELNPPLTTRNLKAKLVTNCMLLKKMKKYGRKLSELRKDIKEMRPLLEHLNEQLMVANHAYAKRAKKGAKPAQKRSSQKQIKGPEVRNLQLHFKCNLLRSYFTNGNIVGENREVVSLVLRDPSTHELVTAGPESCIKIDIVLLKDDFDTEDVDNWTSEDFDSYVVKNRDGKKPLLDGKRRMRLNKGEGTITDLKITDNSSWTRTGKFRLGAKVTSSLYEGIRIREAVTTAFKVKDQRGESYCKHYPPASTDAVWRLEKIAKQGKFHKKLVAAGITMVEDFLRYVSKDPMGIRNILDSMKQKHWVALIEHAETCPDASAIRNACRGLSAGQQGYSTDSHHEACKIHAETVMEKANDSGTHMEEPDEKSVLNVLQTVSGDASQHENPNYEQNQDSMTDEFLLSFIGLNSPEQPSMNSVFGDVGLTTPIMSSTWGFQNNAEDDPRNSLEGSHFEAPMNPNPGCHSEQHTSQSFIVAAPHEHPESQVSLENQRENPMGGWSLDGSFWNLP